MKILFIGGTGRLSNDVAKLSLEENNDVYLLTRGSKERRKFVDEKFHMIYSDISDVDECKNKLKNIYFDVVIDFLTYNLKQLKNILYVIQGQYKQYIFISTATVYKKKNEKEIISEKMTQIGNNLWKYAYDKFICEEFLEEYFKDKQQVYTVIRPYVTYSNARVPYPIVPKDNAREWSLINRLKVGKPIPIINGGNIATTITYTKDFSIGVVGLFMNKKAFNEAFHITSDEKVVWGQVLDDLGNIYSKKVSKVDFTVEQFGKEYPFYRDILIGDKGQTMLFDNSKLLDVVPDYCCKTPLAQGLKEVVDFYESNIEYQKIDYYWDGKIDRICNKYGAVIPKIKIAGIKNQINYLSGRYFLLDIIRKVMMKLNRIIKGLWRHYVII